MFEAMLTAGKSAPIVGNKTLLLLQADKGGVDQAKSDRVFSKVAAVTTTTTAKFNNKQFDCLSAASYFEMMAANKTDLVFGPTDDYTIEFWCKNSSVASSWWLYFGTGTQSCLKVYQSVVYLQDQLRYLSFNSNFWPLSTWAHIAIVNKDGTTKLYINGSTAVTGAGFASGGWSLPSGYARIGYGEATAFAYMDQIRISKVARYSGNFSVPTAPFILD
ncbi:hypothetical protein GAP31_094 [Cronobacter phage vB_CsaM_GAP31]|uniref:LamG-like jellyroll fold domain-containing protein n=1 Tax=Cronobacter phage vB_CsaM_GAP31 TaxID=1141135 RepID=K4FAV9_9CAUD|nr:hypothetical protein GAP31_094 [Cronobacter phage vB_CsaM_GAP31]AFC21274.1 hypothetical protein GAP31_094 [Cronobacter phage vB_CsaM_GAP31]